ncbi:hypothetical protein JX265_013164 [Neoarthrinium moseri]|uniref:NADP-dependent oxidoreductase domain-containing protein n=1 Tax=Neoarthrinium moseri TaxID=1658444 RepID=A0A9Q0AG56_9PEZI|nr:hypothetical protein JX265_013164 [Neoarthrinium moseri]
MAAPRSSSINLIGDKSKDGMVRYDTPEEVNHLLKAFRKRGYNHLDSARLYAAHAIGTSEPRLGAAKAGGTFTIDTKVNSSREGGHSKANILSEINDSLEALRMPQVNILYLHLPDRKTDIKETCEGLDQAYREGKFKMWGICNISASEVQKFMDVCEENGFVKPSVYQGQYNAIVRGAEKDLFPLLRKYDMPFYAYSPAAAGFFAGNHKDGREGSRFDQKLLLGGLYRNFYLKPSIMAATEKALLSASKHGISGHAAALRWVAHHSALKPEHGDSIVFAASSLAQLNDNIDFFEAGPLPADVVEALEAIYGAIGEDEVLYHM